MEISASHSYGDAIVKDSAQAHFGDNVHHHYHKDEPRQTKFEILYESLVFDGIDSRSRNVETPLRNTCQWLRQHSDFIRWADPSQVSHHHGLLWIRGKPGCGKSTLMKETLEWAKNEWRQQLVLSYFFNARAYAELEKSSLGLYRAIVSQILSAAENCRKYFVDEFQRKERSGSVQQSWSEKELQNFILRMLRTKQLPALNLFIDALDEGEETDIARMVEFFEKAADYAMEIGSMFRLCLSSRHYPQISIQMGITIIMEHQEGHRRDIETYVEKNFPSGSDAAMSDVKLQMRHKADGIFLWVVLSLSLLKPLHRRGQIAAMRKKIEEIPLDLYELFSAIIAKDNENLAETITLFQWVMSAMRTLHSYEIIEVIKTRHPESELQEWQDVNAETAENYILHCSRGLIEFIDATSALDSPHPYGPSNRRTELQFIHETVRQFLVSLSEPGSPQQGLWPAAVDLQPAICHQVVAEDCLKYMMRICADPASCISIRDDYDDSDFHCALSPTQSPKPPELVFEQPPESNLDKPFLMLYAGQYWTNHLEICDVETSDRALDLAARLLCDSKERLFVWAKLTRGFNDSPLPSLTWATYKDVVETSSDWPGCIYDWPRSKHNVCLAPAIYYAVALGLPSLLKRVITLTDDVDELGGPYGSALHLAALLGHTEASRTLIEAGADVNSISDGGGTALKAAMERNSVDVAKLLLSKRADIDVTAGGDWTALQIAARRGYDGLVKLLLENGADANIRGSADQDALQIALNSKNFEIVEILLDHKAGIDPTTRDCSRALGAALKIHSARHVRILLEQGYLRNRNDLYQYLLREASRHADVQTIRMLFEGVDPASLPPRDMRETLMRACLLGDESFIRLLLSSTPRSQIDTELCSTALHQVSIHGLTSLVELLLDVAADLEIPVEVYRTALLFACRSGEESTARLLLDATAGLNLSASSYHKALQFAAASGCFGVIGSLLFRLRKVELQKLALQEALSTATERGHNRAIEVLLEQIFVKPDERSRIQRLRQEFLAGTGTLPDSLAQERVATIDKAVEKLAMIGLPCFERVGVSSARFRTRGRWEYIKLRDMLGGNNGMPGSSRKSNNVRYVRLPDIMSSSYLSHHSRYVKL